MLLDLIKKRQLRDSYRSVFDGPKGKEVLRHICKQGHVFEPTFVAGDPHLTSLREGERRLALSILKIVNKDFADLADSIEKGIEEDQYDV